MRFCGRRSLAWIHGGFSIPPPPQCMGLHRILFQLNYKRGICYSSCANCTHTQTQTRTQVGIEPRIQNGNIMAHFLHFRQCFIWGSSILCWLLLFWYRFWSWHASHNGIIIIIISENQREGEKTSKKNYYLLFQVSVENERLLHISLVLFFVSLFCIKLATLHFVSLFLDFFYLFLFRFFARWHCPITQKSLKNNIAKHRK